MAFTHEFLEEILEDYEDADELIEQIMAGHNETVEAIQEELRKTEEAAKRVESLRAEVERLKDELYWKSRYEEVKAELEAAKAKEDAQSAYEQKEKALRSLVLQIGAPHVVAELIVGARRDIVNSIDVQDGKVRNHERVVEAVRHEYGSLIK